ncbi:MAG: IS66 family insertion sequence element accessory protein TnpB [Lachnospiraceae bacterium]|nr:IS66 family insertion sequence element accessory protein TnpB [Lachnospiraceae bacterium]
MATGRTDLRRGIDGLVTLVRLNFGMNPLDGTLFLFCGTKKDRIKGLLFEGDGFCLVYKRLADGVFQWPSTPGEARDISPEQFHRLMDGFMIESSIRSIQCPDSESHKTA